MTKQQLPLKGKTILVTRPKHQAETLCALIRAHGGEPILFPTLEIRPTRNPTQLKQVIQQLDQFAIAIFVSQNAVTASSKLIQAYWPQLPPTLKIAAIGAATAKALKGQHIPVHLQPQHYNSEALLALPELQTAHIKQQKIVIFAGNDGRALLRHTLTQRHAIVHKVETYQRVLPKVDCTPLQQLLEQQSLDFIIATSEAALENLFAMIGETGQARLLKLPLVIISERMLTKAKQLGYQHSLLVAKNASDVAILEAIENWV